ncbi:corrinoid ABC transporter substrate-binding protein [Haloprofundus marisrubri]|uniref:Corrinoid ABC transporter substrate-binding protein n=1 Tax=Haloprofundus marisrubri TaxID=1514971 RepID=A0A0W1R9A3_9EURY|nr:PGF-CTERM-anchored ABC transporter substrate-binding protein [Haloprofundus marisrubri]KTG09883.1 corrinoid ABC transporter substrate-binding protein [Haloprofundus marisrubri]
MRQTVSTILTALVVLSLVAPATATAAGVGVGSVGDTNPAMQADCSFPFTATDATGTEVTIEEKPERVTTLNPSAAQTMWEIGGEEQVVGVSQFALYLDGAERRSNVSAAGFGVNNEKVVATDPDLVLAPNSISPETVEALRNSGLTVFHLPDATNIEDVREKTTLIGQLTGNCAGASEANAWMMQNVDAAENATADAERPSVLYPLGGPYVAGGNTFISAMINASGGSNVAAERGLTGYPEVSDEVVVEANPEILLVQTEADGEQYVTTEPYASTAAGQNGQYVVVEQNYLNQPAPRSVVYAVQNMTEGFHPDADAEFVSRAEFQANANTTETANGDGATNETTQTDEATETEAPAANDDETTTESGDSTDTTGPGFGVTVAVAALAVAALSARRL